MQRDQAHRTNELLERIAIALEKNNKKETETTKDIPGFEGVLNDLDNLYQPTSDNPDPAGYDKAMQDIYDNSTEDEYETDGTSVGNGKYEDEYEYDLQGLRVDSDHDIRSAAHHYESEIGNGDIKYKKDCILDYITNEFGLQGARYTDIIKFAYYLGNSNGAKFTTRDRGYYSCAISGNNAHLTKGGNDFLVKGINNDGLERYFALSFVENATGFWKYIK